MKNFRYPLERLKQFRELEMNSAADEMRLVTAQVQEIKTRIEKLKSSILDAQRTLSNSEKKNGTIQHDLRKLTATYVKSVQQDKELLEKSLLELEKQQESTHAHLLEKKRSVKILENHEGRLSTNFQLKIQNLIHKEDDELWLTRPQNTAQGKIS
jgi:flagellar biosynthesis chaperone FliJ